MAGQEKDRCTSLHVHRTSHHTVAGWSVREEVPSHQVPEGLPCTLHTVRAYGTVWVQLLLLNGIDPGEPLRVSLCVP